MTRFRIAAVSDVHFNFPHHEEGNLQLIDLINKTNADALVIAGDFSAGNFDENYTPWLSQIRYKGPKIAVPGNHDMWEASVPTSKRYQDFIKYMRSQGWHVLDEKPFITERLALVGNMGWYDYSFFPKADKRRDTQARELSDLLGKEIRGWNELKEYLPQKGLPRICTWNDVNFVDWRRPDAEMARFFAEKLEEDLSHTEKKSSSIVAVTHFLPFEEMVKRIYQVAYDFSNAFTGSALLGEAMKRFEKVTTTICGHAHNPQYQKVKGVDAYEVSLCAPSPHLTEINVN